MAVGHRTGIPGADSRSWACYGTIEETPRFIDGIYSTWVRLSTGPAVPVRIWNGPDGFHFPATVGEQVLVIFPNGSPKEGGVAYPGQSSVGQPAPGKVQDDPGKTWVYGAATVHIYAEKVIVEAAKEVHLGEEVSTEFIPGVGSKGVITGEVVCPYTGQPHIGASKRVFATLEPGEE